MTDPFKIANLKLHREIQQQLKQLDLRLRFGTGQTTIHAYLDMHGSAIPQLFKHPDDVILILKPTLKHNQTLLDPLVAPPERVRHAAVSDYDRVGGIDEHEVVHQVRVIVIGSARTTGWRDWLGSHRSGT